MSCGLNSLHPWKAPCSAPSPRKSFGESAYDVPFASTQSAVMYSMKRPRRKAALFSRCGFGSSRSVSKRRMASLSASLGCFDSSSGKPKCPRMVAIAASPQTSPSSFPLRVVRACFDENSRSHASRSRTSSAKTASARRSLRSWL